MKDSFLESRIDYFLEKGLPVSEHFLKLSRFKEVGDKDGVVVYQKGDTFFYFNRFSNKVGNFLNLVDIFYCFLIP